MKILLTGSSGFIGSNLIGYLGEGYEISRYRRGTPAVITQEAVIHLAGKAHDTKNVLDPQEFYVSNTELTKRLFDAFLDSPAEVFIFMSSVKAVADSVDGELDEKAEPNPKTHYGKSKLLAEQYIFSKELPPGKRVYILRPCMVHGPGNKGNLNLLYGVVRRGIPWPLGGFDNKRSFLSVENLCFVIDELLQRRNIPSGIYNLADDEAMSTNQLIETIGAQIGKKPLIIGLPRGVVHLIARIGDIIGLPLNTERLNKLTSNYVVESQKIRRALQKEFPVTARKGIAFTITSFE